VLRAARTVRVKVLVQTESVCVRGRADRDFRGVEGVGSRGALHNPLEGAPRRLHTNTHSSGRLAPPRPPIPNLWSLTTRAYHTHTRAHFTPQHTVWDGTSSSSGQGGGERGIKDRQLKEKAAGVHGGEPLRVLV